MVAALLQCLSEALERHRLPYMVIGGQAVIARGEPRVTRDVDVTLAVDLDRLPELLRMAKECGWKVLPEDPRKFVARHLVLPCLDDATGVRFDFIFGLSPFEREATARAEVLAVLGTPLRVATAEDLVILKLLAGRPRDHEDIRGIVRRNPRFDVSFVRAQLAKLQPGMDRDLAAELQQLLAGDAD